MSNALQRAIIAERPDIEIFHFDRLSLDAPAAHDVAQTVYSVPVESEIDGDRMAGTLRVVVADDGGILDTYVGDWA